MHSHALPLYKANQKCKVIIICYAIQKEEVKIYICSYKSWKAKIMKNEEDRFCQSLASYSYEDIGC